MILAFQVRWDPAELGDPWVNKTLLDTLRISCEEAQDAGIGSKLYQIGDVMVLEFFPVDPTHYETASSMVESISSSIELLKSRHARVMDIHDQLTRLSHPVDPLNLN